jgi:hypothetical protein
MCVCGAGGGGGRTRHGRARARARAGAAAARACAANQPTNTPADTPPHAPSGPLTNSLPRPAAPPPLWLARSASAATGAAAASAAASLCAAASCRPTCLSSTWCAVRRARRARRGGALPARGPGAVCATETAGARETNACSAPRRVSHRVCACCERGLWGARSRARCNTLAVKHPRHTPVTPPPGHCEEGREGAARAH